jgi:hypothetical protein
MFMGRNSANSMFYKTMIFPSLGLLFLGFMFMGETLFCGFNVLAKP